MLKLCAHAKINLGLDVTGRREDGYHLVKMIMQSIGLHDTIEMKKNDSGTICLSLDHSDLPADERNLAYRAALLIREEFSIREGVSIHLKKEIPAAAGMAGGSSDAAAVLRGMNELFALGISEEKLCTYGLKLGADVPFCIRGGTFLSEGIGEILTPLPPIPDCRIVLIKPQTGISTKAVYEALDRVQNPKHPDIDAQIDALHRQDLTALCAHMDNILESVTIPFLPELRERKEEMKKSGALGCLMSGSGPTVFGIFEQEKSAQQACRALESRFPDDFLCVTEPYFSSKICSA